MRSIVPRPALLALALLLVAGAIAFVELRLDATGPASADAGQTPNPPAEKERAQAQTSTGGKTPDAAADGQEKPAPPPRVTKDQGSAERTERGRPERAVSDAERISNKEDEHERAAEIVDPSGFVNADGFSVRGSPAHKPCEAWLSQC